MNMFWCSSHMLKCKGAAQGELMSAQLRVIEIHVAIPRWAWGPGREPLSRGGWDQGAPPTPPVPRSSTVFEWRVRVEIVIKLWP